MYTLFRIRLVWRLSEFAFFVRLTSVAALFIFKEELEIQTNFKNLIERRDA